MSLCRIPFMLAVAFITYISALAQTEYIFVQPALLQEVGDTVTVNVWSSSTTPISNIYVWTSSNTTVVQRPLTYDPVTGFYTVRFPFTGLPDGELPLIISGAPGVSGRINVIHNSSLMILPNSLPQIILSKPLAHAVANPLVPVKVSVTDNTDSTRLILTLFIPSTTGNYIAAGASWDSIDINLDMSDHYGKSPYLLVQAIDSNKQITALKPIPLYVETSPYLTKYFESNGRIIDFNYDKLLVIDNGLQSNPRIVNVPAGTSVPIPFAGNITAGFLTPQGAVLSTSTAIPNVDSLYDYNSGTLYPINILNRSSLKVAGNYCAWTYGHSGGSCATFTDTLWFRDLVSKTNVIASDSAAYSSNGRSTAHSLSPDGSLMYININGGLNTYKNGVTNVGASISCPSVLANPVHDTISYVYTYIDNRLTRLYWNRGSVFSDAVNIDRRPGLDYQVNGKYLAYFHTPVSSQGNAQVYRVDTFNNSVHITTVPRGNTYLELLSPDGDLTFMNNKRVMAFRTGGMQDISSTLGKAYYYNAIWYFTIGNTLFKFQSNVLPDAVTNDTLAVIMNTVYQFKKSDFVNNFGPSPLIAVRITALPLYGTLTKNGTPVILNEVIARNDLDKLAYQPNNGFAAIDTLGWNGFNGLAYASSGGLLKLLIVSPPAQPAITDVLSNYCNNQGAQKLKISNWPADAGTAVSAKLNALPLTVNAADSSVAFNVNGLTGGAHSVTVVFTNIAGSRDTIANFQVTATVTPEVNLGANITHVTNLTTQVVITATNAAGGGATPLYTFASNKTFTNILQPEGTSAVLTINPVNLIIGDNKVYVQMKTSATCYTVQTNIDSILIQRDAATGIIDPNNPGQVITVFPNPFGASITIKGLNSGKKYGVVICNVRGQAIYTGEVKNKQVLEIPASGIKPGVYWMTLYDEKKKSVGTEKIVKY